jgi:hypothetical protein
VTSHPAGGGRSGRLPRVPHDTGVPNDVDLLVRTADARPVREVADRAPLIVEESTGVVESATPGHGAVGGDAV